MQPARFFSSCRPILALLLSVLVLSGCSQKFQNVSETFRLAVSGEDDSVKPQSWVDTLPYASIYARIDEGPRAFMVLALAETAPRIHAEKAPEALQLKWLAADRGMLVTKQGRLVKTLNLPQGNLVHVESREPDPVALGLHLSTTPNHWRRQIDWQPGYHFGYPVISRFEDKGLQSITINGVTRSARYFIEHVEVPALNQTFDNAFWIHPESGVVLMSKQKIAPGLPEIEIQLLKPYGNE
ncbi:YjbF family lipoprotein [Photobacterium sp. 1_MG-2023]|uniref:YjbF family lipoprotein n=1 Tax=Photobacterium sp. 1_MG-2023 TaxID=3062646 RepID=UPI0026E1DE18|nr:YjbF family lipoprotein [Photobacterium sp. 1_MG-2023]MDO6707175.1 YjbF family lipoprotein [Photobacterium sp. 1_MG-2023]